MNPAPEFRAVRIFRGQVLCTVLTKIIPPYRSRSSTIQAIFNAEVAKTAEETRLIPPAPAPLNTLRTLRVLRVKFLFHRPRPTAHGEIALSPSIRKSEVGRVIPNAPSGFTLTLKRRTKDRSALPFPICHYQRHFNAESAEIAEDTCLIPSTPQPPR